MWQILKKVSKKVGAKLFFNPSFHKRIQSCVWESVTPEEFESKWASTITDFDLQRVEWLTFMYGIRDKWIPVYFTDTFFAGIRTTQCSESMNSFFRNFVNRKLSLMEFSMRFQSALAQ